LGGGKVKQGGNQRRVLIEPAADKTGERGPPVLEVEFKGTVKENRGKGRGGHKKAKTAQGITQ